MAFFSNTSPKPRTAKKTMTTRSITKPKPALVSPATLEAMEEIIGLSKRARKDATPDGQAAVDRINQIARQVKALGD